MIPRESVEESLGEMSEMNEVAWAVPAVARAESREGDTGSRQRNNRAVEAAFAILSGRMHDNIDDPYISCCEQVIDVPPESFAPFLEMPCHALEQISHCTAGVDVIPFRHSCTSEPA